MLEFQLTGSGEYSSGQPSLPSYGRLYVDAETGHPLHLDFFVPVDQTIDVGTPPTPGRLRGMIRLSRSWSYSDAPTAGANIRIVPQNAPMGEVVSLATGPGRLAILTNQGQIAFWDLDLRRVTHTVPKTGERVEFSRGDSPILFVHDGHFLQMRGQEGRALFADQIVAGLDEPTGTAMALTGKYPLIGLEDGHVVMTNPGWGTVVGRFKAHNGPVQDMASDDSGRILATTGVGWPPAVPRRF